MKLPKDCIDSINVFLFLVLCSPFPLTQFATANNDNETNSTVSPTAIRDLTLTLREKKLLEQFKGVVNASLQNQPERLREDVYLVRYLRATGFDIKRAEKKLLENLQWREKHRINQILEEDWSEFSTEYPYSVSSHDKYNQPITTVRMGSWDFRKVVLSGKRDKMLRYIYQMMESLDHEIYKQQKKGLMVTRGIQITDIAGFNVYQHGCIQCITLLVDFVLGLDAYYPSQVDKIVLINAPGAFETILTAVKPAMVRETRDMLNVFGTNTKVWKNFLLDFIDEDQLPIEFGGNRVFPEYSGA